VGGHRNNVNQSPDYTGLQLQTSAMGTVVPLAWGRTRLAPNLIDYDDFAVHKKTVGKGGLTGKGVEYTYSATIILALCEGPISGINKTYKNNGWKSGYSADGFTLFTGATPQSPWSYMATRHPDKAFGYQGIAYVAAANYDLGTSETVPSLSYEVNAPLEGTGYTADGFDADCALVVQDFMTNAQYGVPSWPTAWLNADALLSGPDATTTGDSAYQTYCRAMGWGFAPALQNSEQAAGIISRWSQISNTAPVWTGYDLQLIPFGDETVTGNGVTYIPPTAAVFDFGDDDYIQDNDNDPGEMQEGDWFDAYGRLAIECRLRSYDYNADTIDWTDLSASELLGPRQASTIAAHEICDPDMATKVVSLIGNRMVYVRQTFTYKFGPENAIYLPMDVGYITDLAAGIDQRAVRIQSIEEDDDGVLTFVFEEFPGTTGAATPSSLSGGTNVVPNSQVAPGSVNAPIIFEPNSAAALFITGSDAPCVVCAASGGPAGVFDPNWGGCQVYVSTDGSTYAPIGTINQPARMGVLSASYATFGGTNPDATHTLSVNLAESAGTLASASSGADAAAGSTLCVIQDGAGGAVELVGPETATLTGTNAYNLTTVYRGLLGSTIGAHSSGALFARLDNSIFSYQLPAAYIGVTLYFKFASFNIWGNATQDLASCTAYTYTPAGVGYGGGAGGVPTTPTGLIATASGPAQLSLSWTANPSTDNVDHYLIFRANGTGSGFGSASQIDTSASASYTDTGLPNATGYTYFIEAVNAVGASTHSSGANGTTSSSGFGGAVDTATTAEALTAGMVGNLFDSAGAMKVQKANATDVTKPANCFVLASALLGASVTVYLPGQFITGLTSLSPGATYYLDTTGGGITATCPSSAGNGAQIVGVADSTGTKLFFAPQPITGL
jgi:hypothetical protein